MCNDLIKYGNCEEGRAKLTNSQLNNLESAAKSETEINLKATKKTFQDEQLPYELSLITV